MWLNNAADMSQTQSMSFYNGSTALNVTNATGSKTFEIWLDTQMLPTNIPALNVNTTPYTLPYTKKMLTHKVQLQLILEISIIYFNLKSLSNALFTILFIAK